MPQSPAQAAKALAEQAAKCSQLCEKEGMPDCAKICRDTADVSRLLADFIARDAHGTAALTDVASQLASICATECEQHQADHCKQTARVAREAIAAFGPEAATTPRTPSGERL